jgi:hypothetical protein
MRCLELKNEIVIISIFGLSIRLVLAPITGHPYDMALFTYSSRLFYESRVFDVNYFPTLPLVYYLQLTSYSVYGVFRFLGLQDPRFLYHTSLMAESVFLKLPMILSDLAIFLIINQYTKKLRFGTLFFLNPFVIFLSSVWGTYDSLMLLPLVYGFLLNSKGKSARASVFFVISGLIKLFGFVPFILQLIATFLARRFKEALIEIGLAGLVFTVIFLPFLFAGLQNFFVGFVLRFVGLSGAQTQTYNIFAALFSARFGGTSPFIGFAMVGVVGLFVFRANRSRDLSQTILSWSIVSAVVLQIFSQAAPQWLSWVIPLTLLYASVAGKERIAYYSYFYGIAATFLTITLTQGVGYLLTGIPIIFFPQFEAISNPLAVYATTVLALQVVLLVYMFSHRLQFRARNAAGLIVLTYALSYFIFAVEGL